MAKNQLKGKKAKGFSKTSGRYVEGPVYHVYSNGIGIVTKMGIAFVEDGGYGIIEKEIEKEATN